MATIDVHHHFIPPLFTTLWNNKIGRQARNLILPPWSKDGFLETIEKTGIGSAILSLGHPIHPYVEAVEDIAPTCRKINHFAAQLRDEHPSKVGFFATLPPLDHEAACIGEIQYAFDQLHADGVVIFSSYSKRYLGHEAFRAVWQELNRYKAVILIHPGFEGMDPIEEPRLLAPPIIDWTHETTRTAVQIVTAGMTRDFPDCKIILSHAGGTLPYVVNRAANLCCRLRIVNFSEAEFIEEVQKLYMDVAFSAHNPQLKLLREFAKPGHVLFGSDYPWEGADIINEQLVATEAVFMKETRQNALALFPRLRDAAE